MSNSIKKSLAIGSGLALVATGLVSTSAFGAGQADKTLVSLVPTTGTSYNSVAVEGQDFSLSANNVASLEQSGRDMKWLVTDPSGFVEPSNLYTNNAEEVVLADGATIDGEGSTAKITINDASAAAKLATGDVIIFKQNLIADVDENNGEDDIAAEALTRYQVTLEDSDSFSFVVDLDEVDLVQADSFTGESVSDTDNDGTFKILREARDTDNSFVVDSEEHLITNDRVLSLENVSNEDTYSVTVVAWVDDNNNNEIDPTEYTSPERTITWYAVDEITPTTTVNTPSVGDTSVTATMTTSPELNGQQLGTDFFDMEWTAQGNANAVLAKHTANDTAVSGTTVGSTTYDGDDKEWTSTAYLTYALANDSWNGSNANFGIVDLTAADSTSATAGPSQVTMGGTDLGVTISDFAHGIPTTSTGTYLASFTDIVSTETVSASTSVDLVIASTTSVFFTASAVTDTLGAAADITAGTIGLFNVGNNSGAVVEDGLYSARPKVGAAYLSAATSNTANAITATDVEITVPETANVSFAYNENSGVGNTTNDVKVRKGTKSVTVTAVVEYNDDLSVEQRAGAGVPVTGTLTVASGSGTYKVNGKSSSAVVSTDANGTVTFTVTNSLAAVGDQVELELKAQNQSSAGTMAAVDLIWEAADYELFDLKTDRSQPSSSTDSYRSIDKGETYTFDFALHDQWGQPAPGDEYRLQVVTTGRTVGSAYHSLSNGAVSVPVADAAQGSGDTITVTANVQKLTSGVWGTVAGDSWNGSQNGQVVINTLTAQTDAIKIGSSTTYAAWSSSGSFDADVDIAKKATVASDRRATTVPQPTYDDGNQTSPNDYETVVINGQVQNASTGTARPGQMVTVTGPSNVLFTTPDGKVDSFGSLNVLTDSSGNFSVNAFSNIAQKDTVLTFTTPDGATKTQKVTFVMDEVNTATSVDITAPSNVEPGSTFEVVVTVTDKYGNPVNTGTNDQLLMSYTGKGITIGDLPDDTNLAGQAKFAVLLGQNDSGTSTVTVTLDRNNNDAFTDVAGVTSSISALEEDITVSQSITIGGDTFTGTYGTVSAWTVDQGDGTAKVYVKFPTIGEKVRIGHQTGGSGSYETIYVKTTSSETMDGLRQVAGVGTYIVRTIDLASGTNRIRVDVGDDRLVQVRYND